MCEPDGTTERACVPLHSLLEVVPVLCQTLISWLLLLVVPVNYQVYDVRDRQVCHVIIAQDNAAPSYVYTQLASLW
jgi:hypothetical protein